MRQLCHTSPTHPRLGITADKGWTDVRAKGSGYLYPVGICRMWQADTHLNLWHLGLHARDLYKSEDVRGGELRGSRAAYEREITRKGQVGRGREKGKTSKKSSQEAKL